MGTFCSKPKRSISTSGQPAVLTRMISGNTNFAFKLYSELRKETHKNIIFSPSAISMSLAMIYFCANEDTAAEIRETMQLTNLEEAEIYSGAKQLNVFLASEKEGSSVINTSHRLFVKTDKKLPNNMIKQTRNFFDSVPQVMDFASGLEKSRKEVNSVIDSDTNGRVQNFLKEENNPITQETSILTTNAFYFKGKWKKQFDQELTEVAKFTTGNGIEIDVDMMYNLLETGYVTSTELDCQMIEIPYINGDMSMFIILPNQDDGLQELEGKLNSADIESLIRQTYDKKEKMLFKLPKFSLENQFSLNNALIALGMNRVFYSNEANLTKLNNTKNLCLSEVQHKTVFEVDEDGMPFVPPGEGEMGECSPTEFLKVLQITINRPFLFLIQDNRTYAIHVMGRIVNPK